MKVTTASSMRYAELYCLSHYSFLRGASHPEELVSNAAALSYDAIAITDECSLAGIVKAHQQAQQSNIKLIIGSEFSIIDGPTIILLAKNREGYGNLCELITLARRRCEKGEYAIYKEDFQSLKNECIAIYIAKEDDSLNDLAWFSDVFAGDAWYGQQYHLLSPTIEGQKLSMQQSAAMVNLPRVALGGVLMHQRSQRVIQDMVTAIRLRLPINKVGYALNKNGEAYLRSKARLAQLYSPELLAATIHIAQQCTFSLTELQYTYPDEFLPKGQTAFSFLKKETMLGAKRRWGKNIPVDVLNTINNELSLIAKLKYEAYFLTIYDVVNFARSQSILCQGRGSAANSAVCYCLGITSVDPSEMSLLFERFISEERNEPPDIDVDFEHERREEVMQYIYNKYGRERAALAAALVTYRPKSAIRDVAKALGIAPDQIEQINKNLHWWHGYKEISDSRVTESGLDLSSDKIKKLFWIANQLLGFPRHLSQHVGGFVMSNEKLSRMVPIENAAMENRTIIQWDKSDLEAVGLMKVDCLALGMLTAIHRCFDLLAKHYDKKMSLASIAPDDPATYTMIQQADTIGVFQIESRAQMTMLPRLKPKNFYDLVIEIAIIRPGPIQGDMVHPYLRRRNGEEQVSYPNDKLKPVLERTLGIPIFQEQVMQIAIEAAGFSAGEADQLRRSMAAWGRKGDVFKFEERFINGMLNNGYDKSLAERLFSQLKGFGAYGFPESHSASFARLAYISSWLKCHYPAAFTCALLNSLPMGFYAPAQLIQDVKRHGITVLPIDALKSDWECLLVKQSDTYAIRLGFCLAKGVSKNAVDRLVAARENHQISSIEQLAKYANINKTDLANMINSNALETISGHRYQSRWEGLAAHSPEIFSAADDRSTPVSLTAPSAVEDVISDYASTGFTLNQHPMGFLHNYFKKYRLHSAAQLNNFHHGRLARVAGLITMRQRPASAKGVMFITLEDDTGVVNVVIWPKILERNKAALLHSKILLVKGSIQRMDNVIHLVAGWVEDHTHAMGNLEQTSRNFH